MIFYIGGYEEHRQSRPADLPLARLTGRGKSELQRAECWLIASEGDLKESATETYRLYECPEKERSCSCALVGKGEMVR
jgi:hypothetical protein